jgi:DNA-binding GntR family transcriptional regulator
MAMIQTNSSHNVYKLIRERILAGSIKPGARLVNRTLGKELGVSPVPVREALNRLVSDGVVEQIPGSGTFVRKLTKEDLIHLYAMWELLEGYAVSQAAIYARPDQIAELRAVCEEGLVVARKIRDTDNHQATPELLKAWLDVELDYHSMLISLGGNPWLTRLLEQIQLLSAIILSKPRVITLTEVSGTCREHARLVLAINNRDTVKAQKLLASHLQKGMASQLMDMSKE